MALDVYVSLYNRVELAQNCEGQNVREKFPEWVRKKISKRFFFKRKH